MPLPELADADMRKKLNEFLRLAKNGGNNYTPKITTIGEVTEEEVTEVVEIVRTALREGTMRAGWVTDPQSRKVRKSWDRGRVFIHLSLIHREWGNRRHREWRDGHDFVIEVGLMVVNRR